MANLMEDLFGKSKLVADPRTENWPLMNFNHAAGATLAYVAIVLIGKRVFRNLPASEMYVPRVLHNLLMTLFNLYLVIEILIQASKTSWYGPIVRDERGTGMAWALYLFYISKIFEFNDTIIMLFRKSFNQISFLHWYHHAGTFMMWWFNVRYYPGGEAYPSAWLNSFVHVWMYSHYLLATLGIKAWWKKYLTQLQISQLSMFVVQGVSLLWTGAEEFKFIGLINGIYALTILVLFVDFYVRSYGRGDGEGESRKPRDATSADATSPKKTRKARKDD
jgi:elongation of very long chain fatty acids protein 4